MADLGEDKIAKMRADLEEMAAAWLLADDEPMQDKRQAALLRAALRQPALLRAALRLLGAGQ